jgi:bisphosphoglycerate-dependent phosphoglycerate mutase
LFLCEFLPRPGDAERVQTTNGYAAGRTKKQVGRNPRRPHGKHQLIKNKEETMKKYGKEKVHLWRRSYNIAPPGGESLAEVVKRTIPFYKKYVEKDLKEGKKRSNSR